MAQRSKSTTRFYAREKGITSLTSVVAQIDILSYNCQNVAG